MQETPIYMIHDLKHIPQNRLKEGFRLRLLDLSKEDDKTWARILTATEEFTHEANALERFKKEFLPYPDAASKRIFMLETSNGQTAGTAAAWFGYWQGQEIGRLHWVEILPHFQGEKLGRPLIAAAIRRLSQFHHCAYLKTQELSLPAIHLYVQFGFRPVIETPEEQFIWHRIEIQLGYSMNK